MDWVLVLLWVPVLLAWPYPVPRRAAQRSAVRLEARSVVLPRVPLAPP